MITENINTKESDYVSANCVNPAVERDVGMSVISLSILAFAPGTLYKSNLTNTAISGMNIIDARINTMHKAAAQSGYFAALTSA